MLFVVAVLSSCAKDDVSLSANVDDDPGSIKFSTYADWTKGAEVDEISDVSELCVYSYYLCGDGVNDLLWDDASADALQNFFTTDIYTPFTLTQTSTDGSTWSYDGVQYWPVDETRKLSFFAHYPADALTSVAVDGDKPQFSYTMNNFAGNNADLVCDALYDLSYSNTTNGKVSFDLEHALTKLTLKVRVKGSLDESPSYDGKEYFTVQGITFHGLSADALLAIDTSGNMNWTIDDSKATIDLTATQGVTLLPTPQQKAVFVDVWNDETKVFDSVFSHFEFDTENAYNLLDYKTETDGVYDYVDVMLNDSTAMFVLPQLLSTYRTESTEGESTADDDTADDDTADVPTVSLRIARTYYAPKDANVSVLEQGELMEVIYESEEITIPPATGKEGWEQGMHNQLSFTFDLDNLSSYHTPLTLYSTIYDWTDTTVEVSVNPNIYIYASDSEMSIGKNDSYADFYIYTNYEYDLRFIRSRTELDYTTTTANGFTYYPFLSGVYSPTSFTPTLVNPNDSDAEVTTTYSDDTLYIGGLPVSAYESDGGDSFYEVSSDYFVKTNPDGFTDVPCYQYGVDSGNMDSKLEWLKFKVTMGGTYFYYYLALSTRSQLGLYTNSSVGDDEYYGINKEGNDAVYVLRIEVDNSHLINEGGTEYVYDTAATVGYLIGKVGVEMLSNAGGMITSKFDVKLAKSLTEE